MTERRENPFSNVEDTDWGKAQERRHLENQERFMGVERKLGIIDEHLLREIDLHSRSAAKIAELEKRRVLSDLDNQEIHKQLDDQVRTMKSIKEDTQAIVMFAKAAAGFRRFLIWFLPLATTLLTAYITWNVKK